MYQFEYPWLIALLPIPLLVYWLVPAYKEERDSVRMAFFAYLTKSVGLNPAPGAIVLRTNWLQKIVAPITWCLLVAAVARPVFVEPPIQKIQPGRDLMLALDISQSMETPDFLTPDGKREKRVDAVKHVVSDFIARRKGDRVGLIVFGMAAYPLTPFTIDHDTCLQMLSQIQSGMAGPQTMIGDAIGLTIKMFDKSDAKQRVLILLTDGNDTGSRMPPRKAAEIAKQRGILIHVVGVGDPRATGDDKVDYKALKSIAEATGGQVFHGENQAELSKAYATLDQITPQNFNTLSYRPKRPLFMYPLVIASLLVIGYHLVMLLIAWIHGAAKPARNAASDETAIFGMRL